MSVGFAETLTGLSAGQNYVLRVPIAYDPSSRAQPRIFARDTINGQYITWLDGPHLYGSHDGGDGQAALSDSDAPYWSASLIGATVYNITDGSSATVTAAGDSITAALAGGIDNDWDNDDEYRIVPDSTWVWCEPFCFELPTIARNGVASDCTACEWGVLNLSDGDLIVHQVELLENLVNNPSIETGAGNPWIPDGWVNVTIAAGEATQSLTTKHSGNSCIYVNEADAGGIYDQIGVTEHKFYCLGGWMYVLDPGVGYLAYVPAICKQATISSNISRIFPANSSWILKTEIGRVKAGNTFERLQFQGTSSGGSEWYFDDAYLFQLDDVSLTVTPASEANSTENGGLRVDGRDICPQPSGLLSATSGKIKATYNPRHSAADVLKLGQAASYLFDLYEDANNYIRVYWSATNTLTLAYNANGAGEVTDTWDATGLWDADDPQVVECEWGSTKATVKVDGTERLNIAGAVVFATDFTQDVDWGSRQDGTLQFDGIVSAP